METSQVVQENPTDLEQIVQQCQELYEDLGLEAVSAWKADHPGARAIGFLPVYIPREIIHAAGMLPVGLMGGDMEIIRGDAYYQSYICHIPRSTIELAVSGRLDALDGVIFPSICDVIRLTAPLPPSTARRSIWLRRAAGI